MPATDTEPVADRANTELEPGRPELRWTAGLVAVVVAVVIVVRLRLLDMPLERDEGEYAYFGWRLLAGVPPFAEAYNMKLPGAYGAYALLIWLFGPTGAGIHAGLLCVVLGTAALAAVLARRLAGPLAGASAMALYALLSIGPHLQGLSAKAEAFVALFVTAAFVALQRAASDDRWRWRLTAGLLLGAAFVTKQHAAVFGAAGGLWLAAVEWRRGPSHGRAATRIAAFGTALALPYALTCGLLLAAGVFSTFWQWTVDYAASYVSLLEFAQARVQLAYNLPKALGDAPWAWGLAFLGALAAVRQRLGLGLDAKDLGLLAALVGGSLLAVTPGLYFRPHYFVMWLPAAAVLGGVAVAGLAEPLTRLRGPRTAGIAAAVVLALVAGATFAKRRAVYFRADPEQAIRAVYNTNPFPEARVAAQYLREHSAPDEPIAVLGSEPEIYFYAQRRAATGYLYMYPLMERHALAGSMQDQLIREIESEAPEFVVYVRHRSSWMDKPWMKHRRIFDWFEAHAAAHYEVVGIAGLHGYGTRYTWGSGLRWPPFPDFIAVLRRRSPAPDPEHGPAAERGGAPTGARIVRERDGPPLDWLAGAARRRSCPQATIGSRRVWSGAPPEMLDSRSLDVARRAPRPDRHASAAASRRRERDRPGCGARARECCS